MKKVLVPILCLSLSGCAIYSAKYEEGPSPGVNFPKQYAAPYPWVCIIPSENTSSMSGIDFHELTKSIRFSMSFKPYEETFKNVRLILVDFRKLPASTSEDKKPVLKHDSVSYSQGFITQPERYQLKMSFYIGSARPPSAPYLEETISLPISTSPPHEAIMMLSNQIIEDLNVSDQRKLEVNIRQ